MHALCQTVIRHLDAGTPLVLVTMMDQKGSVPRTAGARMLVLPDGSILGTVGGGRYEAEAIAASLDLHRIGKAEKPDGARPGAVFAYSLRGVTDMDMICGGALTMLLEYLPATDRMREVFAAGADAEQAGASFALLARFTRSGTRQDLSGDGPSAGSGQREGVRVERFARLSDGRVVPGGAPLPGPVLDKAPSLHGDTPLRMRVDEAEYLLEPFPRPFRIVLFGGGHVSREVAKLAAGVDFHTTVIDDRPEFANPGRFPGSATILARSLDEADCGMLLGGMTLGPSDGIVIVTRGHSHDRDALAAALRNGAGYIGMIGSKAKRAAIYASLRESGMAQERLDAVRSPIGLAIGAESPAEIAVSIVAELIAWRKSVRNKDQEESGS